nr:hypothetical protein CFP56_59980 [Quercus suber]
MGIALCIVLVPNSALYAGDFGITCSFEVNGYQMKYTHLCWKNCGKIESHRLGLQFLSHYRLSNGFDSDWKEVWSQSDANRICQIGIEISSPNLGVKKIGVHLVFEQEVDDPDQLWRDNSESRESDMDGYNDQLRRDNSECRNKRCRDEEDGVGPSGEAYSNNEPHPKTWRMLIVCCSLPDGIKCLRSLKPLPKTQNDINPSYQRLLVNTKLPSDTSFGWRCIMEARKVAQLSYRWKIVMEDRLTSGKIGSC